MTDPLQALLQAGVLKTTLFPPTSRYHGVEVATLAMAAPQTEEAKPETKPETKLVAYLRRRFCPPPERFALLQEHTVVQGERLDNLTAQYLGDPEQFWRVCDANNALRPEEMTETVGRKVRITLPEGIPGPQNG